MNYVEYVDVKQNKLLLAFFEIKCQVAYQCTVAAWLGDLTVSSQTLCPSLVVNYMH